MRKWGAALSAGFTAALLLAGNAVPVPTHLAAEAQFQDVRFSHILGMTVEDPNAQELGVVKDLVLDVRTFRLEYVIVASGGFLGWGARVRAVPAQDLSAATVVRGTLSARLAKAEWEKAPTFGGERLALAHALSEAKLSRHPAGHLNGDPGGGPYTGASLESARSLLGKAVLDVQRQKLGAVTDLLVDLSDAKPPVVLFCSRKFLKPELGGAAPLPGMALASNKLVLGADRRQLEQAPWFTKQAWQTTARQQAPAIYRVAGPTPG